VLSAGRAAQSNDLNPQSHHCTSYVHRAGPCGIQTNSSGLPSNDNRWLSILVKQFSFNYPLQPQRQRRSGVHHKHSDPAGTTCPCTSRTVIRRAPQLGLQQIVHTAQSVVQAALKVQCTLNRRPAARGLSRTIWTSKYCCDILRNCWGCAPDKDVFPSCSTQNDRRSTGPPSWL
jgi:hypothetical protein